MGDTSDDFKMMRAELAYKKAKDGIDCPGCKIKFPRANPTRLLPGWKCRTCGYHWNEKTSNG